MSITVDFLPEELKAQLIKGNDRKAKRWQAPSVQQNLAETAAKDIWLKRRGLLFRLTC